MSQCVIFSWSEHIATDLSANEMYGDQKYLGRTRLPMCEMPRPSLKRSSQLQGQMSSICVNAPCSAGRGRLHFGRPVAQGARAAPPSAAFPSRASGLRPPGGLSTVVFPPSPNTASDRVNLSRCAPRLDVSRCNQNWQLPGSCSTP